MPQEPAPAMTGDFPPCEPPNRHERGCGEGSSRLRHVKASLIHFLSRCLSAIRVGKAGVGTGGTARKCHRRSHQPVRTHRIRSTPRCRCRSRALGTRWLRSQHGVDARGSDARAALRTSRSPLSARSAEHRGAARWPSGGGCACRCRIPSSRRAPATWSLPVPSADHDGAPSARSRPPFPS